MNFEVGQKWVARNGSIFEITEVVLDHNFPVKAWNKKTGSPNTFTADGWNHNQNNPTEIDLLYQFGKEPQKKFAIGQVWKCRGKDTTATIQALTWNGAEAVVIRVSNYNEYRSVSDGHLMDITGKMLSDQVHNWDLIELITPAPKQETVDGDCECRRKKFNFISCERWCSSYKSMAQMMAMAVEVPVNMNALYRTKSDGPMPPSEEDLKCLRKL